MPEFKELVKNLYTSKNRELTEDKLEYIETNYKGKEEDFVKNFYATIGEELPEEKFNYIKETYLKKKEPSTTPSSTGYKSALSGIKGTSTPPSEGGIKKSQGVSPSPLKTAGTTTPSVSTPNFEPPTPRLSAEEQQAQAIVQTDIAAQKTQEFKQGVKQKLYNDTRYWRLQDKKEAQERGYAKVEDMYKDRESYLIDNYLDDIDKEEASAKSKYLEAKQSGNEKGMAEYYQQYLKARGAQREKYNANLNELNSQYAEIESQLNDGTIDADFGKTVLDRINQRKANLELTQKGVVDPVKQMDDFIDENKTEVASVAKSSQTPYEKLREYTNALYTEVLTKRRELGLDEQLGGLEEYAMDYKLRTQNDAGAELDDLYEKEQKLKQATKLLFLNRTSIEDESALGVIGKSFITSLSPAIQGKVATNQTIANNLNSIAQESDVAKNIYKEQQKFADEEAKDYTPYSAKWFAAPIGSSLAIAAEFVPASMLSEGVFGLTKLGRLINIAEQYGKIKGLNTTAKYLNAVQKYKTLKAADTLGKFAIKTQANAMKFTTTSEAVAQLFPSQADEVNATSGYWGGTIGKASEQLVGGMAVTLFKVFGNKAPQAAKVLSDLGQKMSVLKDAPKTVIGELGEEFGEELGNIYKNSDSWKEISAKLKERFGTLDKATQFVIQTGIMALGMGSGTSIGSSLFKASRDAYNSLPREERAKVDSVLDSVQQAETEVQDEVANEVKTQLENTNNKEIKKEIEKDEQGAVEEPISAGTDVLEEGVGMAVEPGKEGVAGEDIQAEKVLVPRNFKEETITEAIDNERQYLEKEILSEEQYIAERKNKKSTFRKVFDKLSGVTYDKYLKAQQNRLSLLNENPLAYFEKELADEKKWQEKHPEDANENIINYLTEVVDNFKSREQAEAVPQTPLEEQQAPEVISETVSEITAPEIEVTPQTGSVGVGGDVIKVKDATITSNKVNGGAIYTITQNDTGNEIGTVGVADKGDYYQIEKTKINDSFQKKGYGSEAYKNIAESLDKPLLSDKELTSNAKKLWERLVKDGVAEKYNNGYRILPKSSEQTIKEQSTAEAKPTKPVAEQIADLRAAEQAEYDAMANPKDKAKRKEIYDKYDKLITPLLEEQKAEVTQPTVEEGAKKETAKPTKTERKAIAEAKIDDLAAKAKEFLRNKNLPEGTKKAGIGQDDVIDVLASTVKALVNSGIEISEAIKQVRELFEQDFDTSAIKDYEISQAIAKDELTDFAKENGFSSYREAVFAVNKYVREVGKEDVITKEEITKAKEAKAKETPTPKKGYTPKKKKAQEEVEGTQKTSGRSKSYQEGRVPVSEAFNKVVNEQKEYYEQMNQKATLEQAEEYLSQYGNSEQGLLDAYDDMINVFMNNPYLDPKNSIAIEMLSDRMFAKALDFKQEGETEKYNRFLRKSEELRREAFKAHYRAGQFTSAVAIFSRSVNPDAFLLFIDGQVKEALDDYKKTKPRKYEKYEQDVKDFQDKLKNIKKDAAKQAVISTPNSTKKVNVKLSDKLKSRYEQGKKRQEEAIKKLGKINFFGSSGLSNEAIEAVGELVLAQFEQGIYKAATIIDRIREITGNKLTEKNIKDVYDAYKVNYKGEKRTLTELEDILRKEEISERESSIDLDAELEKERERLAKFREDEKQAVLDNVEAERLKRSQTESKNVVSEKEKQRLLNQKEASKLTEDILKEQEKLEKLKLKEKEAQLNRIEALRLKRSQNEISQIIKEKEKQRLLKQKEASKLTEDILKEQERINKLIEKEKLAQSDRIIAERLKRAQQIVKDSENKIKEIEAKAKKAATEKTSSGKRPTISDLIQRDLEADLTKEVIAKNLMTEGGLSEKEANKLADIFYNKYKKILKEKIQSQLIKDLTPRKVKEIEAQMNELEDKPFGKTLGEMIANEVAAGVLDSENLRAAFASKYEIPTVSPIVAANIRALSAKVRAAKTTLGLNLANKNLLNYINSTIKTNLGSFISTIYYTSILSGISTAVVNTYGNVNNLINQSAENFVQSIIEAKQGNKGNIMSNTQAASKIRMAVSNIVESFTSFIDIMTHGGGESRYSTMKKGSFGNFDSEDLILKKKDLKDLGLKKAFVALAKLYKTPPAFFVRNLPASDEGFYMSNFNMEATRELRKKLYSEGLRGAELEKKVYEQVYGTNDIKAQAINEAIKELQRIGIDPSKRKLLANRIAKEIILKKLDEKVKNTANELAKENTFRGKPRGLTGYLSQKIPQFWLITPFVSTPFKMAEKMINYIPFYGIARYYGLGVTDTLRNSESIDKEFKRKGIEYAKREGELRNKQLAQVLTSHLLALVFWGLSQIDWEDEDGKIVPFIDASAGYYGTSAKNREKLRESLPEYTIRIGNFKFSYKTNPLLAMIALPFGVIKDAERSFEDMDFADWSLIYNFETMSFLYESTPIKGLQDFFENISRTLDMDKEDRTWEDVAQVPVKQAAALVSNLVVDNLYKQIFDFYDPKKYVAQDNKEILYKAANMEDIGGLQTDYDRWGREKKIYPGESFFPVQYLFKDKTDNEITQWEIKNDVNIPKINRKTLVLTDSKLKSEKAIENQKQELIKDYGITSEEYKEFEETLNADYKLLTYTEWQKMDKTIRSEVYKFIKDNFTKTTNEYDEFYIDNIGGGNDVIKPISELSRVESKELVKILFDNKRIDYIDKNFTKAE